MSSITHLSSPLVTVSQKDIMRDARCKATFDTANLTEIIYGGPGAVRVQNNAFKRLETALGELDMSKLPGVYKDISREAQFLYGLKLGKAAFEECLEHGHKLFHQATPKWRMGNANPFSLHTVLFVTYLKREGNDTQVAHWVPLAEQGKILGSYCQTELGHGSNVSGIETTAIFDESTDEFIIHTPTLSATKYWPGAVGYVSSHAIVMAQLVLKKKHLGVHPFVVQIRSPDDYSLMPGVNTGDLGPVQGYMAADNGFCDFRQVRIPRVNMLMRHASVSREGKYTQVDYRQKLIFGGMLNGRLLIANNSAFQLAQAVTITTRYSIVRRQGHGKWSKGSKETAEKCLIHFRSQHQRLLTLISQAYAILFASQDCVPEYEDMIARQQQGDHSALAYNHTLICGLKAWATQTAADGAEDARKMAGGQGYVVISGLPDIASSCAAMATFEGDNYVLLQQLADYLMKNGRAEPAPAVLGYLAEYRRASEHPSCVAHTEDFRSLDTLLDILKHRAARLITDTANLLRIINTGGENDQTEDPGTAWNRHMMELLRAARAHMDYMVLSSFVARVGACQPEIRKVLSRLCSLFALTTIVSPTSRDAISFVEDGHLSLKQINEIREQVSMLLVELLPDIVALTDAWNFTDASLASAIGCKDGDAHERLMRWITQLPKNDKANRDDDTFMEGFNKFIKPFFKARL